MKKILGMMVIVASFLAFVGCATTKTKGSGIKGQGSKVDTGKRVLIDYQGATFGSEIPEWVKLIGEGQYSEKVLSKSMPGVENKKVFVVTNRGNKLNYIEQWADLVKIETEVAGIMERVAGKSVEATMNGSDNEDLQEALNMYRVSLTSVRLSGLEKVASYWTKNKLVDDDGETIETFYEYYAVWGMDKKIFNNQLNEALKGIDETSTEAAYLKAKVTEDLIDSVTDGSFTDAYSY